MGMEREREVGRKEQRTRKEARDASSLRALCLRVVASPFCLGMVIV
jgi:hypothetical protein